MTLGTSDENFNLEEGALAKPTSWECRAVYPRCFDKLDHMWHLEMHAIASCCIYGNVLMSFWVSEGVVLKVTHIWPKISQNSDSDPGLDAVKACFEGKRIFQSGRKAKTKRHPKTWKDTRETDWFLGEKETQEPSILAGLFRAGCEQRPWPRFATWGWGDILQLSFWADPGLHFDRNFCEISRSSKLAAPVSRLCGIWKILHQDGQPLDRFCHLAVEAKGVGLAPPVFAEIQRLMGLGSLWIIFIYFHIL